MPASIKLCCRDFYKFISRSWFTRSITINSASLLTQMDWSGTPSLQSTCCSTYILMILWSSLKFQNCLLNFLFSFHCRKLHFLRLCSAYFNAFVCQVLYLQLHYLGWALCLNVAHTGTPWNWVKKSLIWLEGKKLRVNIKLASYAKIIIIFP